MEKLRYKYISWKLLVIILAGIVLLYIIINSSINNSVQELTAKETDSRIRLMEIRKTEKALRDELAISGTDAYIENEARTKYGFLRPGEIRFVISNPEALYEDIEAQIEVMEGAF